ncbi:hypothetical protein H1R20_g8508, partial [Candolleomyces eurysporus]
MAVTTVPIVALLEYLSQNPDYNDSDVISVTHAKNLDSRVKHEYLHLIIRDRTTNRWRRLLAERQTTQDQVIIGFWPWVDQGGSASSSGPVASGDLKVPSPLLMRNLYFEPLDLQSVAKVLLEVHRQKPNYNFFFANCYWYSDAVFQIFKAMARGMEYRKWSWLVFRGIPLILSVDAAQAAVKFSEEMDHEDFKADLETFYKSAGDVGKFGIPHLKKTVFLDEIEVSSRIALAMKRVNAISNLDKSAICRVTKERKKEINTFSEHVLAHSEKEANLAFFESCLSGSKEPESTENPDSFITELHAKVVEIGSAEAPSKEEEARYEEAIRAFAGGVLRKVRDDGVVF